MVGGWGEGGGGGGGYVRVLILYVAMCCQMKHKKAGHIKSKDILLLCVNSQKAVV